MNMGNWRNHIDKGFAWCIVAASFCVHVIVLGSQYSFGVLFVALVDDFHEDEGTAAWVGSLATAIMLGGGLVSGPLARKYGCRIISISGAFILSIGLLVSSFVTQLWHLYLSYGGLVGIGYALAYIPAIIILQQRFKKHRGFATGIAVAGSGVGTFVFAAITEALISASGWRTTLQYLALMAIIVITASASLFIEPDLSLASSTTTITEEKTVKNNVSLHGEPSKNEEIMRSDNAPEELNNTKVAISDDAPEASNSKNSVISDDAPEELNNTKVAISDVSLKESNSTKAMLSDVSPKESKSTKAMLPDTSLVIKHGTSEKEIQYPNNYTTQSHCIDAVEQMSQSAEESKYADSISDSQFSQKIIVDHVSESGSHRTSITSSFTVTNSDAMPVAASIEQHVSMQEKQDTLETDSKVAAYIGMLQDAWQSWYLEVRELLQRRDFARVAVHVVLMGGPYFVPMIHLKQYAEKELNFSSQNAANLIMILGVCSMAGRVIMGRLSGSTELKRVYSYQVNIFLATAMIAVFPAARTVVSLSIVTAIFAVCAGAFIATMPVVVADFVNHDSIPVAMGLVYGFQAISVLLGPPIAGWLYVATGSYTLPFVLAGAVSCVGTVVLLGPLHKYPRQRLQNASESHVDLEVTKV